MDKDMRLPEAQLEIMQIIWSYGGNAMFSQLAGELESRGKGWKTNTILTFLSRLAQRGMITVKKQGRLNEYVALVSESDYLQEQTNQFIEKVYGGDARHLMTALLRQERLTEKEYEELKTYWNKEKEDK